MQVHWALTRGTGFIALLAVTSGCTSGKTPDPTVASGQVPAALVAADTADEPLTLIGGPARSALDSANALYKAKRYTHALAAYRLAARLAPAEPAPLLGMLMTATMLEDDRLGDSVRAVLRATGTDAKQVRASKTVNGGRKAGATMPDPRSGSF